MAKPKQFSILALLSGALVLSLFQPGGASANSEGLDAVKFGLQTFATANSGTQQIFVEPPLTTTTSVQSQRVKPNSVPETDLNNVFALHSDPDSENIIYLDFDGVTWEAGSWWMGAFNNVVTEGRVSAGYDIDGDAANFNTTERENIFTIWQAIAEDFSVFDVDVTTELPSGDRATAFQQKGAVALFLSDTQLQQACGCGGIAHVDVFGQSNPYIRPSLNFTNFGSPALPYDIAEIGSHEIGHNLGLLHDGTSQLEYYGGHAMWAPIMGFGRGAGMVTWSDGGYPDAQTRGLQNSLDDFATISRHLPLRVDEIGNVFETAELIELEGIASVDGIIEDRNDVDVFEVVIPESSSGQLKIDAQPWGISPNLDIELKLYESGGSLIASSNPLTATNFQFGFLNLGLEAVIDEQVEPGTYYVEISGVGQGSLELGTGYSDYASVGRYQLFLQDTLARISEVSTTIAAPGTALNITGLNFPVGGEIYFGNSKINNITRLSSSQIVVGVPSISYFGPITLKLSGRVVAKSAFQIDTRRDPVAPGTVQTNKQSYGLGEKIALSGSNIGAATLVKINGETVGFKVLGANQLEIEVSANMMSGPVEIETPGGSTVTQEWVTLQLPPTVSQFSKTSVKPGDVVVLTGKNLSWITNVSVSGVKALVLRTSNTDLEFEVPFTKSGKITLQNQYGVLVTTQTLEINGTFPRIGSIKPAVVKRGAKVVLTGQNFVKGTKVLIGKIPATSVKVLAMNRLTFVVPAKAKSGLLTLTTFIGTTMSDRRLVIK